MLTVIKADLFAPNHAKAIIKLLNGYAEDPMGGGEALSEYTRKNLIEQLQQRSDLLALLAFDDEIPAGLIISFEGFSTFRCAPLLKGTSRNSLQPLRDLKRVAARREPQCNGYSIAKVRNAADTCFKSRPTGIYTLSRLCVMFSYQAISMLSKTSLDPGQGVKPEVAIYF